MKKLFVMTLCLTCALSLSCLRDTHNITANTFFDTEFTDEEFFDSQYYEYWKNYQNPKSNEEVAEYGYDKNGNLVIEFENLRHVGESCGTYDTAVFAKTPVAKRYSEEYRDESLKNTVHITGEVISLESHCRRFESPIVHDEKYNLPEQRSVYFSGYTETEIRITGVLDYCGSSFSGTETDGSLLEGKVITVRQDSFWYYDDNGELRKLTDTPHRYSYVTAVGTPLVLLLSGELPQNYTEYAENAEKYGELYILDYYSCCDDNGNEIETMEEYISYLEGLDAACGGYYAPFFELNDVKNKISF